MTIGGVGAACGPNPCTWSDYFTVTGVVSPACLQWQQTCSAEAQAIAGGEQAIGQNIGQSITTSFEQTLANLFGVPDPSDPNATPGINWMMVGLAVAAGFVAYKVFVK